MRPPAYNSLLRTSKEGKESYPLTLSPSKRWDDESSVISMDTGDVAGESTEEQEVVGNSGGMEYTGDISGLEIKGTKEEGTKDLGNNGEGTKVEGTKVEGTKVEGTMEEGTKVEDAKVGATDLMNVSTYSVVGGEGIEEVAERRNDTNNVDKNNRPDVERQLQVNPEVRTDEVVERVGRVVEEAGEGDEGIIGVEEAVEEEGEGEGEGEDSALVEPPVSTRLPVSTRSTRTSLYGPVASLARLLRSQR